MRMPNISEEQRKQVEDYSRKLDYIVKHFDTLSYLIEVIEGYHYSDQLEVFNND